jgi:hypothetical protein
MEARSDGHSRMPGLTNRDTERAVLDEFVAAVRAGQSRMLVVPMLEYLEGLPAPQRERCGRRSA